MISFSLRQMWGRRFRLRALDILPGHFGADMPPCDIRGRERPSAFREEWRPGFMLPGDAVTPPATARMRRGAAERAARLRRFLALSLRRLMSIHLRYHFEPLRQSRGRRLFRLRPRFDYDCRYAADVDYS